MTAPRPVADAPAASSGRTPTLLGEAGAAVRAIGVVLLLFVVHELWVTDVLTDRAQQQLSAELRDEWSTTPPAPEQPTLIAPAGRPCWIRLLAPSPPRADSRATTPTAGIL